MISVRVQVPGWQEVPSLVETAVIWLDGTREINVGGMQCNRKGDRYNKHYCVSVNLHVHNSHC